ncbi:MAG: hypothetical protein ACHQRK_03140 [Gemmatimonadales bacterium]
MSPVKHPVSGPTLTFSLVREMEALRGELTKAPARAAKTLIKEGPITVTLIGVKAGGGLNAHKAAGPITLQVLEGEIEFKVGETSRTLPLGTLFALDGGIVHEVLSEHGGIFLLTVVSHA